MSIIPPVSLPQHPGIRNGFINLEPSADELKTQGLHGQLIGRTFCTEYGSTFLVPLKYCLTFWLYFISVNVMLLKGDTTKSRKLPPSALRLSGMQLFIWFGLLIQTTPRCLFHIISCLEQNKVKLSKPFCLARRWAQEPLKETCCREVAAKTCCSSEMSAALAGESLTCSSSTFPRKVLPESCSGLHSYPEGFALDLACPEHHSPSVSYCLAKPPPRVSP